MLILFGDPQNIPPQFKHYANSNPILQLVQKMINYDPSKRPNILQVKNEIKLIPPISNRITISGLNMNLPTQARPGLQSLNLSLQMETLSIVQKSIQLSNYIHPSIISGFVHDQLDRRRFLIGSKLL